MISSNWEGRRVRGSTEDENVHLSRRVREDFAEKAAFELSLEWIPAFQMGELENIPGTRDSTT